MGKKLRRQPYAVTLNRRLSVAQLTWRLSIRPQKRCARNRFPTWKAWHPGFRTRVPHYGTCQLQRLSRMIEMTWLRNIAVRTWCVPRRSFLLLKLDCEDDSTFSGDRQDGSDY